ncbi:MAG: MotA/TolQ/ExbB proton channel family protein [Planctomycetes bacterium]|nr:MotA/TolQ/ExbB proton channel family protein [Planctomycetota bacterium]
MSGLSDRNTISKMIGSLAWPLLIGLAASSMFYVLIFEGPLDTPPMHRYFASHPIAFAEVTMFMVGAAALLLKLGDVVGQQQGLRKFSFDSSARYQDPTDAADKMLNSLAALPRAQQESYFGHRLREALEYVRRKNAAIGLDEELKYLSDSDGVRQQESYSFVRIIIWATPMLGFLGTVVGITKALGDLNPEELANSVQTAMDGLLSGLYVAFDTTAVALTLSIVLMFVQFLVERIETGLLATVDNLAAKELLDRFDESGFGSDPHLVAVDRMTVAVAKTTELLAQKQTDLWQRTIEASNVQWSDMLESSGDQMRTALTESLESSLASHADRLAQLGEQADEQVTNRWEQWQTALSQSARQLQGQQEEMVRQGRIMNEVVKATGEVITLEKALNENLHSLAGSKNFEDTVMSLSAAIHLLNARLGHTPDSASRVELDKKTPAQGRAA